MFYTGDPSESLLFIGYRVIYVLPKKQGGIHDED
uniref:Uncharacterized protein n=1 Tax=Siphoviridae sp. ctUGR26 TaxID=2825527 RepID=A0A8S5Q921_9CAUD|nr:MAG TPA: hypothetical protein [Siphoviridae sp. ctUGR26]